MQHDNGTIDRLIAQLVAGGVGAPPAPPPLNIGDGNGRSGGMEQRVTKLEAHMEQVRDQLAKLSTVPSDLATVKERLNHISTKAEARADLDAAMDRLGSRVQRQVAIVGGLVAMAGVVVTIISRLV